MIRARRPGIPATPWLPASAADKSLFAFEGLCHDIYNETVEKRKQAPGDLKVWIAGRLKAAATVWWDRPRHAEDVSRLV
jgi:hypothetical protein